MGAALDLFIDGIIDDTVREWMAERDVEPAWRRNECTAAGRRRMLQVCRASHGMEAQALRGLPVDALQQNRLRGTCAQLVAGQRFCLGPTGRRQGADVRNEFRTVPPRRDSTRPDLLPRFGAGPAARSVIESKYVHMPAVIRGGALDAAALAARVRAEVLDLRRQIAELGSPPARPGLPRRVRMLYQLGGLHPRTPGRAALLAQAAQVIRRTAASLGQSAFVVDADTQRRNVMRHAARLGF